MKKVIVTYRKGPGCFRFSKGFDSSFFQSQLKFSILESVIHYLILKPGVSQIRGRGGAFDASSNFKITRILQDNFISVLYRQTFFDYALLFNQ